MNKKSSLFNYFITMIVISLCFLSISNNACANTSAVHTSYLDLFNEICVIVEKNFYNKTFIQEQFPMIQEEYRKRIQTISAQPEFSIVVNSMLKQLHASHTYYLSPHDYEYYHLAAIFAFSPSIQACFPQEIMYPTIGIITEIINGHVFVASVLSGGAAEKAGILMGDEILDINGASYQGIDSLKESIGKKIPFSIKRNLLEQPRTILLTPSIVNPKKEMLNAEKSSIQVIENKGIKIGYIHIYSYAGEEYQEELVSAISDGGFHDADALVIDLRYGFGGADPTYLNIFNPRIPVVSFTDNSGKIEYCDFQWRKPVVFLINKAVRSGKEILALGAKTYKLATIIGEQTAGAFLAGSLFPLSNDDFLYLAVKSCAVDGLNLEGIGVAPDIEVPLDIRYCKGKDLQLEKAIDYLVKDLQKNSAKKIKQ